MIKSLDLRALMDKMKSYIIFRPMVTDVTVIRTERSV